VYRARPRLALFNRGGLGAGQPVARGNGAKAPPPSQGVSRTGGPARPAGSAPAARSRPAAPAAVPARRGGRRGWTWAVVAVVALFVVYPLLLFTLAWTSLNRVDALGGSGRVADTPGHTYLVVGSDSRADLTPAERNRLGTGSTAGRRTDTIMLLHVPASGGPTVLVSIPRDSYVPIPGHSRNKINAAYAFGGPQLLVRTVENATGVHIDGYVETGLLGYADLVDAIGGVRVCAPRAMKDKDAHLDIPAGCQQMDGATALGYARARKSDPRGDLGRVERQRQVLAAIAGKTLSPSVLALPWRAIPAARAGGSALTVDQGTSPLALARFVLAMRAVAGGGGLSLTVPIGDPNLSTPAGDAVEWDHAEALRLFNAIKADDTEAIRPIATEQAQRTG
jgi:LCP family protein required for cell wall assembly